MVGALIVLMSNWGPLFPILNQSHCWFSASVPSTIQSVMPAEELRLMLMAEFLSDIVAALAEVRATVQDATAAARLMTRKRNLRLVSRLPGPFIFSPDLVM